MVAASATGDTVLVHPTITALGYVHAAYSAGGSELDTIGSLMGDRETSSTFFRTRASDTDLVTPTAMLIKEFGWKQVIVVSDASSVSSAGVFRALSAQYGFQTYGNLEDVTVAWTYIVHID